MCVKVESGIAVFESFVSQLAHLLDHGGRGRLNTCLLQLVMNADKRMPSIDVILAANGGGPESPLEGLSRCIALCSPGDGHPLPVQVSFVGSQLETTGL